MKLRVEPTNPHLDLVDYLKFTYFCAGTPLPPRKGTSSPPPTRQLGCMGGAKEPCAWRPAREAGLRPSVRLGSVFCWRFMREATVSRSGERGAMPSLALHRACPGLAKGDAGPPRAEGGRRESGCLRPAGRPAALLPGALAGRWPPAPLPRGEPPLAPPPGTMSARSRASQPTATPPCCPAAQLSPPAPPPAVPGARGGVSSPPARVGDPGGRCRRARRAFTAEEAARSCAGCPPPAAGGVERCCPPRPAANEASASSVAR